MPSEKRDLFETTDFLEAAMLRSLGARFVGIRGTNKGVAVLDMTGIKDAVHEKLDELSREIELVERGGSPVSAIDNTFLSEIPGHFKRIKERLFGMERRK